MPSPSEPSSQAGAPLECPRFASRVVALLILAFALVASAAIIAGCLPDLAPLTTADASESIPSAPFQGCGDGVIATLDDGGDAGESCDPGDAQLPGCTACQLVCPDGILDELGHCYFVAGTDDAYNAAATRCREKRAHVVTLASLREVDVVERTVASYLDASGATSDGYWIGLTRAPALANAYGADLSEEPGFPYPPSGSASAIGPCAGCFGVGVDDAGTFALADPDASDTSCVVARAGAWFQTSCGGKATHVTVCEREPIGARAQPCIGGFCFNASPTAGKKNYLVAVSATLPDEARDNCASLDGGSLVVLESREEREALAHEIHLRFPDETLELWIGLDRGDGGGWRWADGRAVTEDDAGHPPPWGNAEPMPAAAGTRAFLRLPATGSGLTTTTYDGELAHADDGGAAPRLYICQRAP